MFVGLIYYISLIIIIIIITIIIIKVIKSKIIVIIKINLGLRTCGLVTSKWH